jgi:hypothetical protein
VESPEIVESEASGTVSVEDGIPVLMPVPGRIGRALSKDRVLIVLLQPMIYIEEEEREKARQGGKR